MQRSLIPVFLMLLAFLPLESFAGRYIELKTATATYRVELAQTPAARRRGLMMRNHLDRSSGMLLVYQQVDDHRIWMKNMLIPIRVYWIDSDARVVGTRRLEPWLEAPCPVYSVAGSSLYVLELSDHEHDLKPGDRIEGLSDL